MEEVYDAVDVVEEEREAMQVEGEFGSVERLVRFAKRRS